MKTLYYSQKEHGVYSPIEPGLTLDQVVWYSLAHNVKVILINIIVDKLGLKKFRLKLYTWCLIHNAHFFV
jgi:hypothetical protein